MNFKCWKHVYQLYKHADNVNTILTQLERIKSDLKRKSYAWNKIQWHSCKYLNSNLNLKQLKSEFKRILDWAYYFWKLQGLKWIKTGLKNNYFELSWTAGWFTGNRGAFLKTARGWPWVDPWLLTYLTHGALWFARCTTRRRPVLTQARCAGSMVHRGPAT